MSNLGFTQEELEQIVRACALVEIEDCTPPYLQDFIAGRLADSNPELSSKVRRLDPDEMDELCDYIKQNRAPVP